MKAKHYLILCLAISIIVPLTILVVPGVSDAIEWALLTFLATNAVG